LEERSAGWTGVLSRPGLALWIFPGKFSCYAAHPVGSYSGGVVLGVLFRRGDPRVSSVGSKRYFNDSESSRISTSGGHYLVEQYWGRYVAFLDDPPTGARRILRDPVGDIPCYRAAVAGIDIYFSDLADFISLFADAPELGPRLTINWEHLRLRVLTGNAWAEESALNEIECIRPGECRVHRGGTLARELYWHPYIAARQPSSNELQTVAIELRSTLKDCTRAWASLHAEAIHVLSGGLDSSIVLSCLAEAPGRGRLTCLNFQTRDPDSDERAFARLAAARAACPLAEIQREPVVALERIFDCALSPGPVSLVMRGLEVQPLISRFAQANGATAVFSGDGGDILFFRGWPDLAAIDQVHCRGLHPAALKFLAAAALPAQLSVWKLLYQAVIYGLLRRRRWDIRTLMFDHYRLVTDQVVAAARQQTDFLNPWHLPDEDLPPGKRLHAFGVTRPMLFRDPLSFPAELDFINPLVSQPVIELCLRIPTYVHTARGLDRAVARAAFAADLPREIVERTWKGAVDRHLQDLLVAHRLLLRQVLLEGSLVKAGILDRSRLTGALSDISVRSMSHASELFGYFCTEVWAQRFGAR
jgi:asparagine synthase (glutamine-hydrolysing)